MKKSYFFSLLFVLFIAVTSQGLYAQNRMMPVNEAGHNTQSIPGLSIYPNPVMNNGKLYIESTKNASKEIELYSVVGKKVMTTTLHSKELVLPYSVNAGIYIMKIREENATATRKIIIK